MRVDGKLLLLTGHNNDQPEYFRAKSEKKGIYYSTVDALLCL